MAPRLVLAASSQSFDQTIISHWQEEGFEVRFEPVRDDSKSSIRSIESIGDTLENGEKYAVVSTIGPQHLRLEFYERRTPTSHVKQSLLNVGSIWSRS
jgi:hypothetical protein